MKNIIKNTLRVLYTGAEETRYEIDSDTVKCDGFDFILKDEDGVISPELSVWAENGTKGITYIIIEYTLSDGYANEKMLYYADSHTTNDRTEVLSLKERDSSSCNCLLVTKNTASEEYFGIGRVTGFRFFSYLGIQGSNLYIQYQMEDKPLVRGKEYRLEKYILGDEITGSFLERYAKTVALLCNTCPSDEIPIGFCSWSRYYGGVDEEKIRGASDGVKKYCGEKGSLVQIDDGWQKYASFPGVWETNTDKFPDGMAYVADKVHENGQKFGLWLAPFLVSDNSGYLKDIKDLVRTDICTLPGTHPLNLDNPETYTLLRNTFLKMTEEYHADYFKLDFLLAGYKYFTESAHPEVRFESDYSIALFRKALQCIRDTVGDGVMLLSCGAPIIECAGIFNYQRASCDIIWGKSDPSFPTFWNIMKGASSTIIHRYFYNNTVFMNDPDGIVVRDIDIGDGFDCSYSEAKFWVATAFVSGGSWLHNEELENLSEGRRNLFLNCIPYLGATGKPLDYFEKQVSTVISKDDRYTYVTFFNAGEEYADFRFELSKLGLGKCRVVKMLDKTDCGITDVIEEKSINPHGAEIYILEETEKRTRDI